MRKYKSSLVVYIIKKYKNISKSEITQFGLEEYIREYESNTFSASGSEITSKEIRRVAEKCINWFVENRLDGVIRDDFLSDIRDNK